MFNNLIESSSHTRELKRRGSFVLFTAATYGLLFVVAGVGSIHAYDASLSEPSTELELNFFIPPQAAQVAPERVRVRLSNSPAGAAAGPRSTRPVLIDRTDNPLNAPKDISALAPTIPSANTNTIVGPEVFEPFGPGPGRDGGDPKSKGNKTLVVVKTLEPPPTPTPTPTPKRILTSPHILNSEALSLPKPPYPILAKQTGTQGSVSVRVLIDETGKVVSAKAISGHPSLIHAAQQAALQARFSPTMLGEQAVKVSGVIVYNFVLH